MRPLALLLLLPLSAQPAPAAEPPTPSWPLWDVDDFVDLYQREVARDQLILLVGGASAFFLLGLASLRAIRKRQRFQFSLGWLLAFVCALSVALCGGVGWWKAEKPDPGDVEFRKAFNEAMEQRVSEEFSEEDLGTVVVGIRGWGVFIFLSPELAKAQKKVSLKLPGVPRREAIRQVCELVGAGCDVRNGAILLYPEGRRPPIRWRSSPKNEWEAAIAKKLSRRISFCFGSTPMPDVVAFTGTMAKVPISLDPALHAENMTIDFMTVQKMRVDDVLTWFCYLADAEWSLARSADGVGEIRITPRPAADVPPKAP